MYCKWVKRIIYNYANGMRRRIRHVDETYDRGAGLTGPDDSISSGLLGVLLLLRCCMMLYEAKPGCWTSTPWMTLPLVFFTTHLSRDARLRRKTSGWHTQRTHDDRVYRTMGGRGAARSDTGHSARSYPCKEIRKTAKDTSISNNKYQKYQIVLSLRPHCLLLVILVLTLLRPKAPSSPPSSRLSPHQRLSRFSTHI